MIANDITVGVYKAGDIIPTQVELAKKYDVSRATITEAVKELTRRKLVKTQRGKGTFVIVQPLEIGNFKRFDGFSSFRSKHRDRNLTSKVIDVSLVDIPEKVAKRFRASKTEKVWRVCRVLLLLLFLGFRSCFFAFSLGKLLVLPFGIFLVGFVSRSRRCIAFL